LIWLKIDFNIVDPEYPSAETRVKKSGLVKTDAGQINTMKKRRPFCVGIWSTVAACEDPSLWNGR